MAIEKMQMMNLIAPLEDMHDVLREIVMLEKVHIKNAASEIGDGNFTLSVLGEHLDAISDIGGIRRYRGARTEVKRERELLQKTAASLKADLSVFGKGRLKDHSWEESAKILEEIGEKVRPVQERRQQTADKIEKYRDFLESIEYLRGIDIDVSLLTHMVHFRYHVGTLTKEKRLRLRDNYENITAVVLHIGSSADGESYLIFSPVQTEEQTEKILKSLNFKEIELPGEFAGTPDEVREKILERIHELEQESGALEEELHQLREEHEETLREIDGKMTAEEHISLLQEQIAVSDNFFYFCAWVPKKEAEPIRRNLEKNCERTLITFSEAEDLPEKMTPPTKLKNNFLMKPFEALVTIYGVPNYREVDPTAFLGLSYLILFGAMFGDVGQGAVLALLGLLLCRREENKGYGGLLLRIGLSSVTFGFLYGSLFGSEEILPALLVRPMENIDFVLYSSVVFGIGLLFISFGISIFNLLRRREWEEGLLGRNGLTGFAFYIFLLIALLQAVLKKQILPFSAIAAIEALFMALMLFRKPLLSALQGRRAEYEGGRQAYYIEGGFDLVETLLSLLSNTISFIRIGAFALNHVGLFLAFSTMAAMTGSRAAGILILVVGNAIIIGLEGLIVFIQGLRLEYYELFSKYYRGDGIAYEPLKMK